MRIKTLEIGIVLFASIIIQGHEANPVDGYHGFSARTEPMIEDELLSNCEVKITKVGCYSDNLQKPRPLPDLIITDRDPTSAMYDGHQFDWENPAKSMKSLACRCAKRIISMGYTHFSLQYFGECWSGKNAPSTYSNDGPSNTCVNAGFQPCDDNPDTSCTGVARSNFVYIATEQTARPTTSAPKCSDLYDICHNYAATGLCNPEFPQVLEYCPKSCKRC